MARLPRSPELMNRDDTALLVVDVQGKLITLIPKYVPLLWNIGRLIDGAKILGLPVLATEQYPKGLGPTAPEIAGKLSNIFPKIAFSCGECGELFEELGRKGIHRILVCGIEAHVCVQQTVHDLLAAGFRIYLAVDAVGARGWLDCETALGRMESAGATLTTVEAALFEWCDVAGTPEFKQISNMIKQTPPPVE